MNLFLTKIEIDYETAHKNGLRDTHAWHRWAWEVFPGRPEAGRDFLTRLDDLGHGFRFLVQSSVAPHRPAQCPSDAFHVREIPPEFFQHFAYRFSLLANPTVKRVIRDTSGNRKKNGRREPITKREDLVEWMERKAAQHGFTVDSPTLRTIPRPRQIFSKRSRDDESRHQGIHTSLEFVGVLRVVDQDQFQKSVITGIGTAKAFGFGMLCLSPIV